MKKSWIILLASLLMLSACAPAQTATETKPGVETIVASTLQAMTAAAQPTASAGGIPVSYHNVTFTIPLELNASASSSTNTDVEFPYINPSGGPMAEHDVFQITNYPVQGDGWDTKIMVFKSSDYAAYGQQDAVTALLGGQEANQPLPKALTHDFYAQPKLISFKNGHGLRYLTQVFNGMAPINNRDLFYYYQGITNDGAYFVSAIFHVKVSFLVADTDPNSPTPSDGVLFLRDPSQDISKYLGDITQKLSSTAPENYTVSLTLLDNLIESVQVSNP